MVAVSAVSPPRFLVSFHPKEIAHRFADVLVIGSGLAGLRAALAVHPEHRVTVLTKGKWSQSNSRWAQGGIAAVWDPEDDFDAHVGDTLDAGKGLCDREVVDLVVREAPERVRELIDWGTIFDSENGSLALGREGGHTHSRILHAMGDATGKEVMRAVFLQLESRPNIQLHDDAFTIDLLTYEGRCVGALTWRPTQGLQAYWADQTVLATGGCGQLFRETTNPPVATGDGLALAYRAGAKLRDMEFVQFHPTVLYVPGSARYLISEAVRGEGAVLRDRAGSRFMLQYDPRAELAPRDVVSQAIVRQMAKTRHNCVYLDQSHLDAEEVRRRFPSITAACSRCGLDFARDLIPVRPGAHYMVGGVAVDIEGRTSMPGLWASGEAAATGLHGANRLASNSLLEALVFGYRCGAGADALVSENLEGGRVFPIANRVGRANGQELDLGDVRNSLSSLMFRDVGIERTAATLENARENVDFWCQYVLSREFHDPAGWELQNMLTVAGLVIQSALVRTESRGTHLRADFPEIDDKHWLLHLSARRDVQGMLQEPVAATAEHKTERGEAIIAS